MSIVALGDLPPNEHDPDGIRGAADDILSGADYDRADPACQQIGTELE